MMGITLFVVMILLSSFSVIGIIEVEKSIEVAVKKKDGSIKYPILSIVLCLLFAGARYGFGTHIDPVFFSTEVDTLLTFSTTLAFIELLGYNVIVKWLFAIVDGAVEKVSGRHVDTTVNTSSVGTGITPGTETKSS